MSSGNLLFTTTSARFVPSRQPSTKTCIIHDILLLIVGYCTKFAALCITITPFYSTQKCYILLKIFSLMLNTFEVFVMSIDVLICLN